ncbi:hypothetical protein BpHYR1_010474 [Brachionus plicatilis]|uniref:Uncharacterized protein n=1 Tax=Brachionus plicatilis TaxID=10195 RepID=A0A3M7S0P8_BRAPC|nr:hypothetical protein BpHYR1_010474 [Brachionus plicatilis]
MKIDFMNLVAFISDNASYMIKAYSKILKALLSNCIHITSLELVGETWRSKLDHIDGEHFKFVAMKCDRFKFALLKFEDGDYSTPRVYEIIHDFFFWLRAQLDLYKNDDTAENKFGTMLYTGAVAKLGNTFSTNLNEHDIPANVLDQLVDEWPIYLKICSDFILVPRDPNVTINLDNWWSSHKDRLPIT